MRQQTWHCPYLIIYSFSSAAISPQSPISLSESPLSITWSPLSTLVGHCVTVVGLSLPRVGWFGLVRGEACAPTPVKVGLELRTKCSPPHTHYQSLNWRVGPAAMREGERELGSLPSRTSKYRTCVQSWLIKAKLSLELVILCIEIYRLRYIH